MPRYKESIADLANFDSIEDVLNFYTAKGLFLQDESEKSYKLVFNRYFDSPIYIPKLSDEMIKMAPSFYFDDDNITLNISEVLKLLLIDRFKCFMEEQYKHIHHGLLRADMGSLLSKLDYIKPFSFNNRTKLENRIRVIKTHYINKYKEKVYFDNIGDALHDNNVPNDEESMRIYSQKFNDPIAVSVLSEGTYCSLPEGVEYKGVAYKGTKDSITSVFKDKSNLPERTRQHYTSSFLEPVSPDTDWLAYPENRSEKTNAMIVYMPVKGPGFEDVETPLGDQTLITSEVLISRAMAEKKFYVHRTFLVDIPDAYIVPVGTVLQPNKRPDNVIAYDAEGFPAVLYDLKYENALVEDIIQINDTFKVIVKVASPLGTARITGDYGIKGVTHPREDLGYIKLPDSIDEGKVVPVDMVIGPPAMKSEANGVRLSWMALQASVDKENIIVSPDEISQEEITEMTQNMQLVDWFYKGNTYKAYCGLMSFGVTDLAKDCRTRGVRVMPETLKYMYTSGNQHLIEAADAIRVRYARENNIWILQNLLLYKSREIAEGDDVPVFEFNDPKFLEMLNEIQRYNPSNWKSSVNHSNNILLNPFNRGFYIKLYDTYLRMPGADIINTLTSKRMNGTTYPPFLSDATLMLLSIKQYANNRCTRNQIIDNYRRYVKNIDREIFSKKKQLSKCLSPEIPGGNLKQIVSCHVPPGVTVVLDKQLNKQIKDFRATLGDNKGIKIFEIGVRNPVLWRFQFTPRVVWSDVEFSVYLKKNGIEMKDVILLEYAEGSVLRSITDTLYDRADTDGDLYPIAIPLDLNIQIILRDYMRNPVKVKGYEKQWVNNYIAGEMEKNKKFINIHSEPFEYHTIPRTKFGNYLAEAAIAKTRIGMATVELWKFHTTVEWFYHSAKRDVEDPEELKRLHDKLQFQQFLFSRIVQETVVDGVKHNSNGASGYDIFSLRSIEDNKEQLREILKDSYSCSEEQVEEFIDIALHANKDEYCKALSRLPSGGQSEDIAKLVPVLREIEPEFREISYAKLLEPYWEQLEKMPAILEETE